MAIRQLAICFLVLFAKFASSELVADDPTACIDADESGIVYELSEIGEKGIRLCYAPGVSSVVKLNCDWDSYKFDVEVALTKSSDPQRKLLTTAPEGRAARKHGRNVGRNSQEVCRPGSKPLDPILKGSYSYLTSEETKAHEKKMVIRDGRLFYETTVYLSEVFWSEECDPIAVDSRIHLSCCAVPDEAVVDPLVIPPLNVECELDGCKSSKNGKCECSIEGDDLQLAVSYTQSLDNTFGFHLLAVNVVALGAEASSGLQLFPSLPANHAAGIRLEQCDSHANTPNPILHYASKAVVFSAAPTAPVQLQCQVQLCARKVKDATATRPLCSTLPSPAPPKPSQCKEASSRKLMESFRHHD